MKLSMLWIALAAIAIPGVVRADVIGGSITLPANLTTNQTLDFCNSTNFNSPGCEFVVPDLTLPAGDTLNSVTISFTWTGTTTINIDNHTFSTSKTSGNVQTGIDVNLVDPNTGDPEAADSVILLPGTYTSFCVGKNCVNNPSTHSTTGEFETIGPFTNQTGTASLQLTDPTVLAGLLAGDVIKFSTYTATSAAFSSLISNGNTDILQSTNGSASAQITYDYSGPNTPDPPYNPTTTPEPATCGLFGSALAGLIVFRKRFAR